MEPLRAGGEVKCGPLTFLTLKEGVLMGAYRTKDGRFEESPLWPRAEGRMDPSDSGFV